MKTVIFGGGDIASKGIIPIVGGEAIPESVCDVSDPAQVRRIMYEEKPDVVIVTAGLSRPQEVIGSSINDWYQEIETNLLGSYHVAKYAVETGVQTLIFIASVAGLYGKGNHSGYSASKAGVRSLMQSLAMEGHNAYAISPGRVDTKLRQADYPGDTKGSRLEPIEIGSVVQDILAGKYTAGENIIIRRIGLETAPIVVDDGSPWKQELKVGQPVTI